MATRPASVATTAPSRRGPWLATVATAALRAQQAPSLARMPMATWLDPPARGPARALASPGKPSAGAPHVHLAAEAPAARHSSLRDGRQFQAGGCVHPHGGVQHRTKPRGPAPRRPKPRHPWQVQHRPPAGGRVRQYRPVPSWLLAGPLGSSHKASALHPAHGTGAVPPAPGNGHSGLQASPGAAHSQCAKPVASAGGSKVAGLRQGIGGSTAGRRSGAGSASLGPSPTANWSCSPPNEEQWRGPQGATSPPRAGCDRAPTSPSRRPCGPRTALGQDPSSMPANEARARRSAPSGRSLVPRQPSTTM